MPRSRLDPAATSQYVARRVTSDTHPEEPRDPRRADGRLLRRPLDGRVDPRGAERATWRDVVAAYVGLTKPRVIELLLLTTVPVMFFAARGVPPLGLVVATVVGGALSAGSASALNCVYDRDIDEQMRRTRRRALPRHIVSPLSATVFGVVLGVLATVVLLVWVNPLSALLALLAEAFYLVVYTMLLKRRTTQNIVWGGLAGCFPALIGWTAVTGSLSWAPVVLFLVVFFWTPPHTWALALRYREDYAGVDVPMLPVVAPGRRGRPPDRPVLRGDGGDLACCCGRSRRPAGSTPSPPRCSARPSSCRPC